MQFIKKGSRAVQKKLIDIKELHQMLGGANIVSEKTLKEIARELGFRKGRAKQKAFNEAQARRIQEEIECQSSIHHTHDIITKHSRSGVVLTANSEKSRQTQQTILEKVRA